MRERQAKTPTEFFSLPCIFPDGKQVMVKNRKDLDVLDLLKKAREEERTVTAKDIVDVIRESTPTPISTGHSNRRSVFMIAYQRCQSLIKISKPAGWTISKNGLAQEATYELKKIKELEAAKKISIDEDSEEEKYIIEKEQPKAETTLNGGRFRTPEQKIEDRKRAFIDFTIAVLSVIAGEKGLATLSRNPDEIVRHLPNGEHIAKVLPQSKEELTNELIYGFETTINEMRRKYKHKPRIEFSEKEKHVFILLKEVKRKNPDFKIPNMLLELKKHLTPASSPAPGFPKVPGRF